MSAPLFSYDPEFRRWYEGEMRVFQREFQVEGKRGMRHKIRPRWVRRRGSVDRFPVWYVFDCDVTREGTDGRLGTPELVGGPFVAHAEAESFVETLEAGRRVFYFGGRNFDLTPPKVAAVETDRRVALLRASVDVD